MKRSPLRRRPKRRSAAEREAHARFKAVVLSEPCLLSQTRTHHRCEGPLDAHHVCRQQTLRGHFARFGDVKWERIHDPANGVALCRKAHAAITTRADWLRLEELPARVVDWAQDWGLDWLLERETFSLARSGRSDLPCAECGKPRSAHGFTVPGPFIEPEEKR